MAICQSICPGRRCVETRNGVCSCRRGVEIDVRYADTHTNGYFDAVGNARCYTDTYTHAYFDAVGNAGSDMSTVGMHHE